MFQRVKKKSLKVNNKKKKTIYVDYLRTAFLTGICKIR